LDTPRENVPVFAPRRMGGAGLNGQ
jgi:hypothetical protein